MTLIAYSLFSLCSSFLGASSAIVTAASFQFLRCRFSFSFLSHFEQSYGARLLRFLNKLPLIYLLLC